MISLINVFPPYQSLSWHLLIYCFAKLIRPDDNILTHCWVSLSLFLSLTDCRRGEPRTSSYQCFGNLKWNTYSPSQTQSIIGFNLLLPFLSAIRHPHSSYLQEVSSTLLVTFNLPFVRIVKEDAAQKITEHALSLPPSKSAAFAL